MALSIGAVSAEFIANTKGFVDNVEKAEKSVSGFAKNLGNTVKDVASFGLKIGTALAGITSVAGGFAIKNASELQMLASSFETLTGSIEEGRKQYAYLVDKAAKTPFETKTLAKATQTMLAFGMNVEKSNKMLDVLGDVSMGNSQKLESLSLAYAQVQSTGRLMGQDLLQMVNQGFNPLQIISEKTGKSMETLKGEMEDGAISADMVTDAFISATSEGGLFYQGMDKGAKTLSGTFSTLKDNITLMGTGLIGLAEDGTIVEGSLLSLVQNGVNFLNDKLGAIDWTGMSIMITGFANNVIQYLSEKFQYLSNKLGLTKDGFSSIDWAGIGNTIINFSKIIIDVLVFSIGLLIDTVKVLNGFYQKNKWWIDSLIITIGILGGAFLIITGIITAFTSVMAIATTVGGVLAGVIAFLTSPIGLVVAGITLLIFTITTLIRNWDTLVQKFPVLGAILEKIKQGFNLVSDSIGNFIDSLSNIKMPKALTDIVDKIKSIKDVKLPSIGKIPGFATGVRNFGGGLAQINERGPEAIGIGDLVYLPKGADVFTNSETKDMMRGTGGGNITNNFTVNNLAEAEYISRKLALQLRTS